MSRVFVSVFLGIVGVAACSTTPDPGEYVIYRIAAGAATLSAGCYGEDVPPDISEDTSNLRTNGIFMLFANADGKAYYLDVGPVTLDGTYDDGADDDTYNFTSTSTDVEYSCSDGTGDKLTASTQTEISLVVDGEYVSGTMKTKTSFLCVGDGCPEEIPEDCTAETTFVGNEMEDAQLEHTVGAGDPTPIPGPVQGDAPDPDQPPVGTGGNCAPTCNHDECEIGGPLDPTCNPCADIVCMNNPTCCVEGGGWSAGCVTQADFTCDPVTMNQCADVP